MKFKTLIKKLTNSQEPLLAVLIDPDKFNLELILLANKTKVSCFLVGGSKLEKGNINSTVLTIKKNSRLPIILFPGDEHQLSKHADGLFLPSLLSGRNPDYLIEKQIAMAPLIRKMDLSSVPMAYLLINKKNSSSTQKITKTLPMDISKTTYIINTAIAAELLGFKLLYLEAGSGANKSINRSLIQKLKLKTSLPILVGGGINTKQKAKLAIDAGANMVVIGNALEKNVYLLNELSDCF